MGATQRERPQTRVCPALRVAIQRSRCELYESCSDNVSRDSFVHRDNYSGLYNYKVARETACPRSLSRCRYRDSTVPRDRIKTLRMRMHSSSHTVVETILRLSTKFKQQEEKRKAGRGSGICIWGRLWELDRRNGKGDNTGQDYDTIDTIR